MYQLITHIFIMFDTLTVFLRSDGILSINKCSTVCLLCARETVFSDHFTDAHNTLIQHGKTSRHRHDVHDVRIQVQVLPPARWSARRGRSRRRRTGPAPGRWPACR